MSSRASKSHIVCGPRQHSYHGAIIACCTNRMGKYYIVLGSTAPIYQYYQNNEEPTSNLKPDIDNNSKTHHIHFYCCDEKRKPLCEPVAFDFTCLTPAEYLDLRRTCRFTSIDQFVTQQDFELVCWCIAYQQQCDHEFIVQQKQHQQQQFKRQKTRYDVNAQ